MHKGDELNNLANKDNQNQQKLSENDEYVLSEWQAPKNKTGFFIFLVSTIFFLAFGIVFLVLNQQINEYSVRYDVACPKLNQSNGYYCNMNFTIDANLQPPVYVYYELNNYFQNHRVYLESRDDDQLYGTYKNVDQLDSCTPIIVNNQVKSSLYNFNNSSQLDPNDPATPCGLIAQTFFNDNYTLYPLKNGTPGAKIAINESNISWKYDRDNFKNTKFPEKQWMDHENEHFQVWMRAAGLSKFRKLWGRISDPLNAGDYQVSIYNQYDVSLYDAKKYFVITTVNALGGKNTVLVYSYMITGGICFLLTIIFLVGWVREKKYKRN